MLTINLQYIAYIFWAISLVFYIKGIYYFLNFFGGPDISNLIAINLFVVNICKCMGIAILGYLIFRAFK